MAVAPMTDAEVARILGMPKRIGERMRWRKRKDDRPNAHELRAAVIPFEQPDYDRELTFLGEHYISRQGTICWSVGLLVTGMKQPLVRIDNHAKPHDNEDGTHVTGCMMHLWSEAHSDRVAVAASDIVDCEHVHAALLGFLTYANIELLEPYQMKWEIDQYGQL